MVMRTLFIFITTFYVGLMSTSSETEALNTLECQADISVEKDRNFKSADESGATFIMLLENKSTESAIFDISSQNITAQCSNNPIDPAEPNVQLNVSYLLFESDQTMYTKITMNAGQTYKFRVKVTVPNGTPFNRWGCIQINAKPELCHSYSVNTVLSVYVPNPSEG